MQRQWQASMQLATRWRGLVPSSRRALSASEGSAAPAFLILGANGGIGSALAERLVAAGGRVALCARDGAKVHALADRLSGGLVGAEAPERIMAVQVV
jgi:anti-sigma factor RsiW